MPEATTPNRTAMLEAHGHILGYGGGKACRAAPHLLVGACSGVAPTSKPRTRAWCRVGD